jgi:metallopeptidase MepB
MAAITKFGAVGSLMPLLLLSSTATALAVPASETSGWRFTYNSIHKRSQADTQKQPPQAPIVFKTTPEAILSDAKALAKSHMAVLDNLTASVTPENATFANVMIPITQLEAQESLTLDTLTFYSYVSGDKALRDASEEASTLLTEVIDIEAGMREDVFKLVDHVYSNLNSTEKGLDLEDTRLVTKDRKSYIASGLGLPAGEKREQYKALMSKISDLEIQFNRNLNEENGSIWLTRQELAGVPEDALNELEKGTGENDGKLRLTFKDSSLVSDFAQHEATRKKVYLAVANKVSRFSY